MADRDDENAKRRAAEWAANGAPMTEEEKRREYQRLLGLVKRAHADENRDDVLRDFIDAVRCLNATLNKDQMSFQNYDAVFSDLLARLESQGEAKAHGGSTPQDTAQVAEAGERDAHKSRAATPPPAELSHILPCALHNTPLPCLNCAADKAMRMTGFRPTPPADEVSDETLRMFATTIARDNESLRVTARAALAARADLAAARRERDEARAEVERLREAARLVVHNAFRIDNNDGYMKIGARWIAALRAALTPTQEPKP